MDKDRIAGSAKEIKGAVKETIGTAIGDAKLQSDGKAGKVEGKVQNAIGGVKDAMRDALNTYRRSAIFHTDRGLIGEGSLI